MCHLKLDMMLSEMGYKRRSAAPAWYLPYKLVGRGRSRKHDATLCPLALRRGTRGKARDTLRSFDGPIDAVVGYWDLPSIVMLPILRREFGLRGPTLESVLRCQHKYWSRVEQARAVPDEVPGFALTR
jgi:hypothetical protein